MDIESLIRCFNERRVDYIVIGAMAMPAHGYFRASRDIDLLIRPTPENAERALSALTDAGYDMGDIEVETVLTKKLLLRQYALRADIHPSVRGLEFDEAWSGKMKTRIGSTPMWVASLDDLIKMKRAAGRPKDLEDLKALEEIKGRVSGKEE